MFGAKSLVEFRAQASAGSLGARFVPKARREREVLDSGGLAGCVVRVEEILVGRRVRWESGYVMR